MAKFDHEDVLSYCDSFSRLPTLLEIAHEMHPREWLKVLGDEWSGCDNIGYHIDDLADQLQFYQYPIREMMDLDEQRKYDELPEIVEIYRGCYSNNKRGMSWSLVRAVAEKFPFLLRYRQPGQPLLVRARVRKSDIVAVKLDRGEMEIITFNVKIISTSHVKKKEKV